EEGLFIITRPVIYPGRHFNHVLPRGRRDCERLCRRFDFLMGNCEKSVLPRPPAQPLRLFKSESIYIPCNLTPLFAHQFFLFGHSCCIFSKSHPCRLLQPGFIPVHFPYQFILEFSEQLPLSSTWSMIIPIACMNSYSPIH